jgi:S-DNA-T family DNA segregation ATPase FtsK/SpoIIIE
VARALGGRLKIRKWTETDDGNIRLAVAIRAAGETFRALAPQEKAKREAEYAAMVGGRDVTISPDAERADRGFLTIHRYPPPPEPDYAVMGPWPGWPGADDFSEPLPVGETKTGKLVTLQMVTDTGCRNILMFGQPGSGKSVAASEIEACAAQDSTVAIWGADGGGGTDLEFWRDRMTEYEVLPERVFLMLRRLDEEIKRRGEAMAAARRRKIDPHDPKILVIMEEFATFTDDKTKRSFATGLPSTGKDDPGEKLIDLQARCMRLGRKYGVGFLCITQVPTVDAVPGKIRRLFQYRWGFKTLEAVAWRAGFGSGIPFVRLDADKPGDSVLVTENGTGIRLRSYFISDEELEEIAAATSLAPVDSLAPDTDTISADLCLETGENGAAPSEIVAAPAAAPGAAPYVPDAWDLAVLAEAGMPGKTGAELISAVGGLSAGAARKRLKILTGAGYLSAPPRPKVTDPQLYVTTITGREALKREEAQ